MKFPTLRCLLASLLGIVALSTASAPAQMVIGSVPYTITAAGHYTINENLTSTDATQPAITISAPNVVLDLNEYYVAGPGNPAVASADANSVIYVGDVANVTIMNGTVAGNGCGILFAATTAANSRNYIVDSVLVTRCYLFGISFKNNVGAPGSVVRDCTLSIIGGSTTATNVNAIALSTYSGVRMVDNNIAALTPAGNGVSVGISISEGSFALRNTIAGCTYGIINGKYLDNLTFCTTPFSGGTNATGNN